MTVHARRTTGFLRLAGGAALSVLLLSGCASYRLDSARNTFYQGRFAQADTDLKEEVADGKDRLLVLMERGTIRQARHAWKESTRDFLDAAAHLDQLPALSVSKDTASLVINDSVQDFSGAPYERTLLHAFTAKNYLAQGQWDDAGVEARLIIRSLLPEMKGDYPEDAYSRYMAGFCLELTGDPSNAALQYRRAGALVRNVSINETTGRLSGIDTNGASVSADPPSTERPCELTCFVLGGKTLGGHRVMANAWTGAPPVYAEILHKGRTLGRSYTLTDTVDLAFTTDQMETARKAVKTIARVAIKEGIAAGVGKDNDALCELVRFVLIQLLEEPDVRRWETLPRWLGVARVPCPADLREFDVVFKSRYGTTLRTVHVTSPIARHGSVFFSFCRDLVPAPEVAPASVSP